jgi:repressor LexA
MARKPIYLTERQKAILEFIEAYASRHGIAPTLREICEHFGYSSYGTAYKHLRLLGEKGFLRRDWNQKRGLEILRPAHESHDATAVKLPFHGRIAAGQPIEAIPDGEAVDVPAQLLGGGMGRIANGRSAGRAAGNSHYVLQVLGESMLGEGILDGDWVVVERRQEAEPGEMVVALIGQDATLKRFYPEGEVIRLQPSNPSMAPIRVPANEVRVQGVVVGLMRRF